MHVAEDDEHGFALSLMIGMAQHLAVRSILDVGSGTGRALMRIKKAIPDIEVAGIEPSPALRNVGYAKGLSRVELIAGDALALPFADNSYDLTCEFGALHHIPRPSRAVSEMLRVSRKAIFIYDSNNFGQGSGLARLLKQAINSVGLWQLAARARSPAGS
jgi:ubiquinone/menaquinone biosynthesis C-methylase UbiE